jgi:hypothetical protein
MTGPTNGKLSGTRSLTVNNCGTLLLSGAGGTDNELNTAAGVALASGALSLGGMTTSLTHSVGALTLTAGSIFDFGTLLGGNTFKFAASNANWSGLELSIYNYRLADSTAARAAVILPSRRVRYPRAFRLPLIAFARYGTCFGEADCTLRT